MAAVAYEALFYLQSLAFPYGHPLSSPPVTLLVASPVCCLFPHPNLSACCISGLLVVASPNLLVAHAETLHVNDPHLHLMSPLPV